MKLIRCYIENFGKLHKFEYEFKDGLNIINEENGFGKTTFATFIKSMFYGLDTTINVKTENSERKKYMPWQGGIYGGNIEFETKGKKYKIERFFSKKPIDDTFKLYDLSTNLESNDYTNNIGEELFKINKTGYERSTYIPQGKIQIEMEDSLNAKLSNVLENDNDVNTSEEALKLLNESKKIYKKERGKGGLIDEKKEKLNALERELENVKLDFSTLELKKQKLDNQTKEISKIESVRKEKQKLLEEKIEQDRKAAKMETYQAILAKERQAEDSINNLNNFSKSKIVQIDEELQIELNNKNNIQKKLRKYKNTFIISLILAVLFIITGGILIISNLQKTIGIVSISIGIITIFLGIIVFLKYKNTKLIETDKKIEKLEADKKETKIQVEEFLKNSLQQFEKAQSEKEIFERENNISELKNIQDISYISEDELKSQISRINIQINNLIDEKNQLKNQIEFLENKIDENEYLESDIQNLKEDIQNLTEKYYILSKTENLLSMAKTTFSASYLQQMTDGFNRYLQLINNKNMNTNVDINLNVKIDSNGAQKEIKYFSSGYKDLIYICMRFSLIEALFKNEKPFVILDDPFVNLDENKTVKALEVVDEFSKKYQIIYFICNSSRI